MPTAAPETVKTASDKANETLAAASGAFKDQVEKSVAAMRDLSAYSAKNFEALVASATAAAKGAEALGAQALAFSKKSLEDQAAAAKAMTTAKSVQELIEAQTSFARSAFEAYVAEATKMGETFTASVRETVQPISERVTAFVERVQAVR
ncbi:MAG TPA: TIGR01841 family phasin [Caulobacteraceae bacterium]|nr:TIGR01841 family phasin [Caulobacteraceae bacterium]